MIQHFVRGRSTRRFFTHPARRFFLTVISIIIPTLNEETSIRKTLESLMRTDGRFEILVTDGKSDDSTKAIASKFCRVVTSPRGRGLQMNCGASVARGDVLLFLHADTVFPPNGIRAIERIMENPLIIGGNFDIHYEGGKFSSHVFTLINRWRRRFGIFYGDSGIFVRREVFDRLGGFQPLPLMEDYDFARKLVKAGKTVCLSESLLVSARRWEEHGLIRTLSSWLFIHVFYYLGLRVDFLTRFYPHIRKSHVRGETIGCKKISEEKY